MSIDYNKAQFELFPRKSSSPIQNEKAQHFWSSLSLSLDNIVVLAIVIMMAMVLSFSLGVEKGKRVGAPTIGEDIKPQKPVINRVGQPPLIDRAAESAQKTKELMYRSVQAKVELPSLGEIAPIVIDAGATNNEKTYTVQVASFKLKKYAQKEASDLEKSGHDTFVLPKGKYSIVCVGKFSRRNEAQLLSSKLRKLYKDCIIRRL